MRLKNCNVLITGTTRGIGKATKELLIKKGCNVYSWNRNKKTIPKRVDILINNAGVYSNSPFNSTRIKDIEKAFYVNFYLPFTLTKYLYNNSIFNKNFSVVLNILTVDLEIHPVHQLAYNCSKAALRELTVSLNKELFTEKVFVTGIYLPLVKTDFFRADLPYTKKILTPNQAGRLIWETLRKI